MNLRGLYPWLWHLFADGGYAGDKLKASLAEPGDWTIEIIKRSGKALCFEVLPRRRVVERTFESAIAWMLVAHIRRLTRRLARA
jgi:transposase